MPRSARRSRRPEILYLMKVEFGRARRHGYPMACVLLRVDRLERLTDRFGHELRDLLRKRLGGLVAAKTRDHDHVGLMGDASYLLVLPHTDGPAAERVAERMRRAFADQLDLEFDGQRVATTLSLGIATCSDRDLLFFETLVSQAELALDRAQRGGGDRAETFRRELFVSDGLDLPADSDPGRF